MTEPSNPAWRYGVALFPLSPLLWLVAVGSVVVFASIPESEIGVLVGIGAWVLAVLSSWVAIPLALLVAASLYLDARSIARFAGDAPNQYVVGGVGLVHVAGSILAFPYVVSVPAITYYLYRRRRYVS